MLLPLRLSKETQPMDQTTSHSFIGRESLLDEIKRHLLKGRHVALYGSDMTGLGAVLPKQMKRR